MMTEVLSSKCGVLSEGAPRGAMLVPNMLRERLVRYAGIAERSHALSVVGTAARLEKGRIAALLAERLFGVAPRIVDEDEALRRVGFSRDFWLVWLRAINPGSAEAALGVGEGIEGRAA